MYLTNSNSLKHLGALLALAATFAAATASTASADLPHTGNLPTWGCYPYEPLMVRDARFTPDPSGFVPVAYTSPGALEDWGHLEDWKWFQAQPESRGRDGVVPTWGCYPRDLTNGDRSGFTPDPTGLVLWYGAQPPIPL